MSGHFLINNYRNLDRREIQFDFLVHSTEVQYYEKEILNLGVNVYKIE